ncbi:MAG: DUF349 domain-containing protein [Gammaproteobacteria bacterium]|nr:MAG: DUF349 domain-containing protein [Gammaproteobacteria bacterium]
MFLSNIFSSLKPKWQHKDENIRAAAITSLATNTEENKKIIQDLLKEDSSPKVRLAALKKVADITLIANSMHQDSNEDIQKEAKTLLIKAILGKKIKDTAKIKRIAGTEHDSDILEAIIKADYDIEISNSLIAKIEKQSVIESMVCDSNNEQTQLLALEKIDSEAALERIIKKMRTKSKRITKAAKEKLNLIIDAREKPLKILAQQKQICQSLETIVKKGYDAQFRHEIERNKSIWSDLEEIKDKSCNSRYEDLIKKADAILKEHEEIEKQRAAEEKKNREIKEQKQNLCDALQEKFKELKKQESFDDLSDVKELISYSENAWRTLDNLPLVDEKLLGETFNKSIKSLNEFCKQIEKRPQILEQISALHEKLTATVNKNKFIPPRKLQQLAKEIRDIRYPVILGDKPQALTSLLDCLTQAESNLQKQEERISNARKELPGLLDKLETEIENGKLEEAKKLHKRTSALADILPEKSSALFRRYKSVNASLNRLQDWKGWATAPKKEELCQQMEALIGGEIPPEKLAEEIQSLQKQWKKLGSVVGHGEQDLWTRFKEAADKAYEPCSQHFDEQTRIRGNNLKQKEDICATLEKLFSDTDWNDKPAWREIISIYHKQISKWKEIGFVDRKDLKSINNRFDSAIKNLKQHINGYYKENKKDKEELIEKVSSNIELDDINSAIEKTIFIQKQWKEIGPTFRSDEQPLWNKFRSACDAVFEKRRQQNREQNSILKENLQQKNSLVEQIEKIAELPEDSFFHEKSKVEELQNSWNEITEISERDHKSAEERLKKALYKVKRHEETLLNKKELEKQQQFNDRYNFCINLEQKIFSGTELPEADQITSEWQDLASENNANDKILDIRFKNNLKLLDADREQIEQLAQENLCNKEKICLKGEILLGVDSPEQFREQRMKLQMENLESSMKNSKANIGLQFIELQKEWYSTGIVTTTKAAELEERFSKILAASNKIQ